MYTVPMELEKYGIYIKSEIPSEILFEIDNLYKQSLETIREAKKQKLKSLSNQTVDGMDFEKYVIGQISMGIINELDESGKATDYAKTKAKSEAEIEKWKKKYLEEKAKPKKRKSREKKKQEPVSTKTDSTEFLTEMPKEKKTVRERVNEQWTNFSIYFTDEQAGIVKEGKRLGVQDIDAIVQSTRASYSAGANILEKGFFDFNKSKKVGKAFNEIWDSVYAKGDEYRVDFYEYLFN